MNPITLEKLEWQTLLEKLSSHSQTEEARALLLKLTPDYTKIQILTSWQNLCQILVLLKQGARAPISALEPVDLLVKRAILGSILDGTELLIIKNLLFAVEQTKEFLGLYKGQASCLESFFEDLQNKLPLRKSIEATIDAIGCVKDSASEELKKIRSVKKNLKQKIEERLKKLIHDKDISKYLQDEFYTYRLQRYVLPISLDGKGRALGSVIDSSASGQTLYIEPTEIASFNEELLDLEVEEKAQIIKILRELTQKVAEAAEPIKTNYRLLIDLDLLFAKTSFAHSLNAIAPELLEERGLHLIEARHPLLVFEDSCQVVPSTIILCLPKKSLIISGPNAGGKTVVLKTIGLIHTMAKAGLLLPIKDGSKIFLFEHVHMELGDAQSLTASLSTFSGHMKNIISVLKQASSDHLVLLDEIAVGTEPNTGASLAQGILEELAAKSSCTVSTTHFDPLKMIAISDERFGNASMEYEEKTLQPTYRLILDVPGQSYGLEVASKMGMPESIIQRAKNLRGSASNLLEQTIKKLSFAEQKAWQTARDLKVSLEAAEHAQTRWKGELRIFEQTRKMALQKLKESFEERFKKVNEQFIKSQEEFKKHIKTKDFLGKDRWELQKDLDAQRKKVEASKALYQPFFSDLAKQIGLKEANQSALIGRKVDAKDLSLGDVIFYLPFHKEGRVIGLALEKKDKILIEISGMKISALIKDIHLIRKSR